MAADRFSFGKSFDTIQARHVGTGHSDMTKFEWAVNQHRDTIGSHLIFHISVNYNRLRLICYVI